MSAGEISKLDAAGHQLDREITAVAPLSSPHDTKKKPSCRAGSSQERPLAGQQGFTIGFRHAKVVISTRA